MTAQLQEPQPAFQPSGTLSGHTRAVANAKFSPPLEGVASGALLATASADSNAMLWDPSTCQALRTLEGHTKGISDVAWSPNCQLLCTASDDATLRLWDVETGACLRTLVGHTNFVFCCSFSPHGHLLASGSFDETMRVWDVRSSTCLREVPAHSDPVTAVHFSWDGTLLASSSLDGLIRVWDTATSHCLKTLFDTHSAPVSYVRFTPNGRFLLSASLDSRIRLWDYERGKAVKFYSSGHTNTKFCASCTFGSEQGAPSAVVRQRGAAADGQPQQSISASPWVLAGSEDGCVYVYGLNSQKVLQVVGKASDGSGQAHADAVLAVDMHPSLPLLVSCGHQQDSSVRVWEHRPSSSKMEL